MPLVAFTCGIALLVSACGGSGDESAPRTPQPAPEVVLTAQEKQVWAPLPPDRSAVPVLLYHGIGAESDFSNEVDASYGIDFDDFAKQMTMIEHAGYQTIDLPAFLRFVRGEPVDLPPRPLLLTFDDGRADSWTGSDGILERLGLNAVMFVDVGRVDDGDPEYLSWQELQTVQSSGRWQLQLHSGHGHQQIQYGPGPNDYGPYYAYEQQGETFAGWRNRVRSDIDWGEDTLADRIRAHRNTRLRAPLRQLRAERHQRPAHPGRPARLADRALRRGLHPGPKRPRPSGQQATAWPHPGHACHERRRAPLEAALRRSIDGLFARSSTRDLTRMTLGRRGSGQLEVSRRMVNRAGGS